MTRGTGPVSLAMALLLLLGRDGMAVPRDPTILQQEREILGCCVVSQESRIRRLESTGADPGLLIRSREALGRMKERQRSLEPGTSRLPVAEFPPTAVEKRSSVAATNGRHRPAEDQRRTRHRVHPQTATPAAAASNDSPEVHVTKRTIHIQPNYGTEGFAAMKARYKQQLYSRIGESGGAGGSNGGGGSEFFNAAAAEHHSASSGTTVLTNEEKEDYARRDHINTLMRANGQPGAAAFFGLLGQMAATRQR